VRGTIFLADVCLDLDDPSPPRGAARIVVDEVDTEERAGDLECRPREERGDVAQERNRNIDWRSLGSRSPKTFMKPGISRDRNSSDVFELS
jgi:hypothetical protein